MPEDFMDMYLKTPVFDFSAAKAYLVTSKPGTASKDDAEQYGQLRLRRIVRDKILKHFTEVPKMVFEVCVGSVGHLEAEDFVKNLLESCAGGVPKSKENKLALKMVFPTRSDVERSNLGKDGASNISSHIVWESLPECLKDTFYHYQSKDPGWLFHMKNILALHADKPDAPPLVVGMGALLKVEDLANFECGVVIKGRDIVGMLETSHWQDIVPYRRPSETNVRAVP
ncbi:hypothetical protein C8R44DRAFT_889466 [Mycena epipterygia]|nr:hypothetical protein C8R44DRAFT_889466 [Mycena epipterygia]